MRRLAATVFGLMIGFAVLPAAAQVDCSPYCDFTHDYGPRDMSWQRSGLNCRPRCDARGNCAPAMACWVQAPPAGQSAFETGWIGERRYGRITVRSRSAPR